MTTTTATIPVFDGHNDTLSRLLDANRSFFDHNAEGHIDLPRARQGGLGGGFCAIFVPPSQAPADAVARDRLDGEEWRVTPDLTTAQQRTMAVMAQLFRIERESEGQVRVVGTAEELRACLHAGIFAVVLHIEGAEAIDPEMNALEVYHRAGLRSLGLVWSRTNAFGHGVPFAYPASPDTGPGLTDAGRDLVRACNRLRIMVDLSHLNEQGFWDVARISNAPLVATHSNAHDLCSSTRNLTAKQLDAIRDSDGMVGVNFCVSFLREDGGRDPETPLETVVRHFDYLVERLGIDRVGFGSDFDGANIPAAIGDAAGLPRLLDALRRRGYGEPELHKLAHENWVRVLRATWGV